ncbi:MAG: flavin reductase family protein [Elusimicrobia bacterium]|nr:flavin reductase family protein [Elusimicrobiota bacterium]
MYKKLDNTSVTSLLCSCGVIIVSASFGRRDTLTPVAWHMPLNDEPPMVALVLDAGHFVTELIYRQKEFVINIPDISQVELIQKCGAVSGRDINKIKEFNVEVFSASNITAPKIKNCAAYIECALQESRDFSGAILVSANVVNVEVKEEFFDTDWITDKFKSVHITGSHFASSLGERFKIR